MAYVRHTTQKAKQDFFSKMVMLDAEEDMMASDGFGYLTEVGK